MWIYTLYFMDYYNRKAKRSYQVVGADYTTARANADLLLSAAQNLTEGYVAKDILSEVEDIAGAVTAGANVDEGASLQFSLGGTKTATLSFPMPIAGVRNVDGTIDILNAAVSAFTGLFTGGNVYISDGENAVDIIRGVLDR